MNSPIAIGLGAGIITGLLFISATGATVLSFLLFYLTPLPLFLAGFGWGMTAIIICALTAAGLIALIVNPATTLAFSLALAIPAVILCYLAALRRELQPGLQSSTQQTLLEWYPVERLIFWTAVMAGLLASLAVFSLGSDVETYRNSIETILDKTLYPELKNANEANFGDKELAALNSFFTNIFPAASAMAWLSIICLNMYLASRIAQVSERNTRPRENLTQLDYPVEFSWAFGAAILLYFAGGMISLIAYGFIGAFFLAYVFLGLAIVHKILPQSNMRTPILFGIYAALFFLGWAALPIALMGLTDPLIRWRQRFDNKASHPPPPD